MQATVARIIRWRIEYALSPHEYSKVDPDQLLLDVERQSTYVVATALSNRIGDRGQVRQVFSLARFHAHNARIADEMVKPPRMAVR